MERKEAREDIKIKMAAARPEKHTLYVEHSKGEERKVEKNQ